MKRIAFVLFVAVIFAIVGCGSIVDTLKYGNGAIAGHYVQAEECSVETAVLPAAKVVKIKEAVLFDFDKSVIRNSEEATLDKIANLMKSNPDTVISLDAYTCSIGTDKYNAGLAAKRAEAVKTALITRGVPAEKISKVTSVGETELFGKIKKENRRVMVLTIE